MNARTTKPFSCHVDDEGRYFSLGEVTEVDSRQYSVSAALYMAGPQGGELPSVSAILGEFLFNIVHVGGQYRTDTVTCLHNHRLLFIEVVNIIAPSAQFCFELVLKRTLELRLDESWMQE